MSDEPLDYRQIAERFLRAEQTRTPIEPVSKTYPQLTAGDAYRVQHSLVATKLERGTSRVGWKVGATNPAIQALMGIEEPVYGHLLSEHRVENGGRMAMDNLIHPKIECEIAFQLGQDLAGPDVDEQKVWEATAAVRPSLEINDPRTVNWRLTNLEIIADNGVVVGFVVGDPLSDLAAVDLREVSARLTRNGVEFGRGTGEAILGDPMRAVAWLANKLYEHGQSLSAGDIILSGSLMALGPIERGDVYEATFDPLGRVSVVFD
jgi:2-keto-4-pentenoate hydratase